MRFEPPEPSIANPPLGQRTAIGVIIEDSLLSGVQECQSPGTRSSSPNMLLGMIPVPGMIVPLPSPFEMVNAAPMPVRSTTEIWVVPRVAALRPSNSAR